MSIINKLIIFFILAIFCIPFIYLFEYGFSDVFNSLSNLFSTSYLELIFNTFILVSSVTITTSIMGLFLSWTTEMCNLKYKKLWKILLIIPLVIPSYFAGYLFILFYGPKGEFFQFFNNLGIFIHMPKFYGFWGAWLCLSFLCFPYVYINLCSGIKLLDRKLEEASRVLGYNHFQTFLKIIFPSIKNSMIAGGILVALYTLSDFGAVSALQYNTFTLAIYTKYRSFDFSGAASSSIILIMLSIPIIYYAISISIINSYKISQRPSTSKPKLFNLGQYQTLIQFIIFLIVFVSLVVPFLMIFTLVFRTDSNLLDIIGKINLSAIFNTFLGSTITAIICVSVSLFVILNFPKKGKKIRFIFENFIYFGFTLPGLVVALSFVYFAVNYFFQIYQTWTILILGYSVLFLSSGYGPIRTSVELVGDKYMITSKSLGKNSLTTFLNISLPLYKPGILKGFLNIFILTAKELPVTLILAPLNFHTLSTLIWDNLEEANFSYAGIYGLLLIIIIAIPTYLSIHIDEIKIKFSNKN